MRFHLKRLEYYFLCENGVQVVLLMQEKKQKQWVKETKPKKYKEVIMYGKSYGTKKSLKRQKEELSS